jgi:hypothetical protein
MVVMFRLFAGSSVQKGNFNSIAILLELVKSLENRRNFRKLQTQFFYIPGEEYYNFCYTHLGCFLIFLTLKIEM